VLPALVEDRLFWLVLITHDKKRVVAKAEDTGSSQEHLRIGTEFAQHVGIGEKGQKEARNNKIATGSFLEINH
jgi:hypothetical protein